MEAMESSYYPAFKSLLKDVLAGDLCNHIPTDTDTYTPSNVSSTTSTTTTTSAATTPTATTTTTTSAVYSKLLYI